MNTAIEEQKRWKAAGRGGLDMVSDDREKAARFGKFALPQSEGHLAGDAVRYTARVWDDAHADTEAESERLAGLKP